MPTPYTRNSSERLARLAGWLAAGRISGSCRGREAILAAAGAPRGGGAPARPPEETLAAGHRGYEPGRGGEGPAIASSTHMRALPVQRLHQHRAVVSMRAVALVETRGDLLPLPRRVVEVRHVSAVGEARQRPREVAQVVELGGALVPEGLEVLRVDEVADPHAVDVVAERVVLDRVADLVGVAPRPFLHHQVDVGVAQHFQHFVGEGDRHTIARVERRLGEDLADGQPRAREVVVTEGARLVGVVEDGLPPHGGGWLLSVRHEVELGGNAPGGSPVAIDLHLDGVDHRLHIDIAHHRRSVDDSYLDHGSSSYSPREMCPAFAEGSNVGGAREAYPRPITVSSFTSGPPPRSIARSLPCFVPGSARCIRRSTSQRALRLLRRASPSAERGRPPESES